MDSIALPAIHAAIKCNFAGLDRNMLAMLHNRMLELNMEEDMISKVRMAIQKLSPTAFNPETALVVHATTTGQ